MSLSMKSFYIFKIKQRNSLFIRETNFDMVKTKKSLVAKKPKVVGVEILKKNGLNVDKLVKQLITNASVEFTAYYYFHKFANALPLEWKVKVSKV